MIDNIISNKDIGPYLLNFCDGRALIQCLRVNNHFRKIITQTEKLFTRLVEQNPNFITIGRVDLKEKVLSNLYEKISFQKMIDVPKYSLLHGDLQVIQFIKGKDPVLALEFAEENLKYCMLRSASFIARNDSQFFFAATRVDFDKACQIATPEVLSHSEVISYIQKTDNMITRMQLAAISCGEDPIALFYNSVGLRMRINDLGELIVCRV